MYPIFEFHKTASGCRGYLRGPPALLALLPTPDSTGIALAEIRKGVWVVKDNDCREFPSREGPALFYLDTELVRPAQVALIPVQAIDDDTPINWPRKLSQAQVEAIFNVLVRFLGAPENRRKEFLSALVGIEAPVAWEFKSWAEHRFQFEHQIGGPDFHGDAMTATNLSTLLMQKAYLAIRALHRSVPLPAPASPPPTPTKLKPKSKTKSKPKSPAPAPVPASAPVPSEEEDAPFDIASMFRQG